MTLTRNTNQNLIDTYKDLTEWVNGIMIGKEIVPIKVSDMIDFLVNKNRVPVGIWKQYKKSPYQFDTVQVGKDISTVEEKVVVEEKPEEPKETQLSGSQTGEREENDEKEKPKKKKKSKKSNPLQILKTCGNLEYRKERDSNAWMDSMFYRINKLRANNSGNVGERFINDICKACDIPVQYEGTKNKNTDDGTYDIKIMDKRNEIKTARIGLRGCFQHESLRNCGCDYYIFVNILPNYFYLTILPKFDLSVRSEVMGVKAHLRKGTSNVFKFTFKERHLLTAIKRGYSYKIDASTSIEDIKLFIVENLKK